MRLRERWKCHLHGRVAGINPKHSHLAYKIQFILIFPAIFEPLFQPPNPTFAHFWSPFSAPYFSSRGDGVFKTVQIVVCNLFVVDLPQLRGNVDLNTGGDFFFVFFVLFFVMIFCDDFLWSFFVMIFCDHF
jgi:hypothetical protein